MSNGKGSSPRPLSVPKEEFDKKWDKIDWSKREDKKEETKK